MLSPSTLVKWLRAAGEPSRLRLLALCADGALSVSDLAQALRQSEPRVSRHLKILCVPRTETLAHGAESRLGRALAELTAGGLGASLKAVLVYGVSHPELLESAAHASRQCTAIAHSGRAAQSARAFAERRGFACRVLRATTPDVLSDADLARAGEPFDAVLLDTFASGDTFARMLQQARRVLTPNGRLWVFERYESLDRSRERIVEHPLARLRRLLGAAGLSCERLSPVEADGEHVLAAVARPATAAPGQLSGTAGARP